MKKRRSKESRKRIAKKRRRARIRREDAGALDAVLAKSLKQVKSGIGGVSAEELIARLRARA